MYEIPLGFMNAALAEVRCVLFSDLGKGQRLNDDHYFTVAANVLWSQYLCEKDNDSSRDYSVSLTLKDVIYGCKHFGMAFSEGQNAVTVSLGHHRYSFTDTWHEGLSGGPADKEGNFHWQSDFCPFYCFSINKLFLFMMWFDTIVDSCRDEVLSAVTRYCQHYKRAQILQVSGATLLEPGLEEVSYHYCFTADDDGERLLVWLYHKEDEDQRFLESTVVKMTVPAKDFMKEPDYFRAIILAIGKDYNNYIHFTKWARLVNLYQEDAPLSAGIKQLNIV